MKRATSAAMMKGTSRPIRWTRANLSHAIASGTQNTIMAPAKATAATTTANSANSMNRKRAATRFFFLVRSNPSGGGDEPYGVYFKSPITIGGAQWSAGGMPVPSRTCEAQACAEDAVYRCYEGHFVCLWHTIRILGYKRRCIICMDSGKTEAVEALSTVQLPWKHQQ